MTRALASELTSYRTAIYGDGWDAGFAAAWREAVRLAPELAELRQGLAGDRVNTAQPSTTALPIALPSPPLEARVPVEESSRTVLRDSPRGSICAPGAPGHVPEAHDSYRAGTKGRESLRRVLVKAGGRRVRFLPFLGEIRG